MLLHAQYQEITDDFDLVQVARNFGDANDERKKHSKTILILHSPL